MALETETGREVYWLNARQEVFRRRMFGKKTISVLVSSLDSLQPTVTRLSANDINSDTIHDASLRYALRFQDAINVIGCKHTDDSSCSSHFVQIEATDDGPHSQVLEVAYSGQNDDLEQSLRDAELH